MIYIGLFVAGVSFAAAAAMYTPKRKTKWNDENVPEVITIINVKRRSRQ